VFATGGYGGSHGSAFAARPAEQRGAFAKAME
jgi:hypothetical protein